MIDFKYYRFGLKFRQLMFLNNEKINFGNEDVCLYHNFKSSIEDKRNLIQRQYTIYNNLEISENELENKISKNYRYEIRRAQKEGIKVEYLEKKEILKNKYIIDELQKVYNDMFRVKKMKKKFNKKYILGALANNNLVISIAKLEEKSSLVYHVYIVDEENVFLLYSCSTLWNDKVNSNLIGYANKYLHWSDMCYFKKKKKIRYEWGGISSKETPNGIDRFKLGFGGEIIQIKNGIIGNTLFGKIYVKFLKGVLKYGDNN